MFRRRDGGLRFAYPSDVAFARDFSVAPAGAAALGHALQRARMGADELGLGRAAFDDEPAVGRRRVFALSVAPALPAEHDPDHRRRPRPGGARGALAAAGLGPGAALDEQAHRRAGSEAVQADFGLPVAVVGAFEERAGFAAVGAAMAGARIAGDLEVAPRIHVAMPGRATEQPLGLGPAFAEGVLDDFDPEHALAHGHGDLGIGLRCFAHAGAAGVGDPEALVEPLEEGRQELEHWPLLSVSGCNTPRG
ncbi:MAG TPA: hypothetical protein VJY39_20570 [Acidisphaera sp.]|nr:hypothetical protein [Acidisphaera sp.]